MQQLLVDQNLDSMAKNCPSADSAWVERLSNWQFFYHVSQVFGFSLLVDEYYWPEILVLDIPNTNGLNLTNSELKQIDYKTILDASKNLIEKVKDGKNKLSYSLLKENIEDNSIFGENDKNLFRCTFSHVDVDEQICFDYMNLLDRDQKVLKQFKFKNNDVNKFFENNFSNIVSMQIRRGSGIRVQKEYIETLKEHVDPKIIKNYYQHLYKVGGEFNACSYPLHSDEYYYSIIEKILENDPNQKIYVSYDVPKSFINHILEKYPNNLVTKHNYLDEYLNFFNDLNLKSDNHFLSLEKTVINLLDFFALAHSGSIVSHAKVDMNNLLESFFTVNQSGWIYFSLFYKPKKVIHI